jgi:hypothetical protein
MSSKTKKTKIIRSNKKTKNGSKRKKSLLSKGSTPKFAIHP